MTRTLPILPLRDIVVFPHRIVPLFVGRDKSVAALEAAMATDKELFLVAQLDPSEDDPDRDALYDLGVIATAMQLLKLPDGTVRVLVEGAKRARLTNLVERGDYLAADVEEVDEEGNDSVRKNDDVTKGEDRKETSHAPVYGLRSGHAQQRRGTSVADARWCR
jgi:ATP-dependent Lon protease